LAQKKRLERGLSQTEFAQLIGLSVQKVSHLEHQRVSISEAVIEKYVVVLAGDARDAREFRELAQLSNKMRQAKGGGEAKGVDPNLNRVVAILSQFGHELPKATIDQILGKLSEDLGNRISPNALLGVEARETQVAGVLAHLDDEDLIIRHGQKRTRRKKEKTPRILLGRFVELVLSSEKFRDRMSVTDGKLDVGLLLDRMMLEHDDFDLDVVGRMPKPLSGKHSSTVFAKSGTTIFLEMDYYKNVQHGYFERHLCCHEISHYLLHKNKMPKGAAVIVNPAYCDNESGVSPSGAVIEGAKKIDRADTIDEIEADIMAALIMVPWQRYLSASSGNTLADDYRAHPKWVKTVKGYLRQDGVLRELRERLWAQRRNDHPIFAGV